MATHSSVLVWRIPGIGEPGALVSDSLRPHGLYWTIQSMEFSRLEYWSGLPFPSPGDLRDPQKELEGTSLVAQMVKHLSTMWETQVQSLG